MRYNRKFRQNFILGIVQAKQKYSLLKPYFGVEVLDFKEENEKITLPKDVQKQMLKFFLKTSIPRIKQEKLARLSENTDRGDEQ